MAGFRGMGKSSGACCADLEYLGELRTHDRADETEALLLHTYPRHSMHVSRSTPCMKTTKPVRPCTGAVELATEHVILSKMGLGLAVCLP